MAVAFIGLAAIGTVARALVGRRYNRAFPSGTLAINVGGAFALGLLHGASPAVLTAVGAGGLGAFTTFSSFARDAVALLEERRAVAAVLYVASTVAVGVAAAALGITLAGGW